jgi:hypothetical protein
VLRQVLSPLLPRTLTDWANQSLIQIHPLQDRALDWNELLPSGPEHPGYDTAHHFRRRRKHGIVSGNKVVFRLQVRNGHPAETGPVILIRILLVPWVDAVLSR